jgi:hypothetical protein
VEAAGPTPEAARPLTRRRCLRLRRDGQRFVADESSGPRSLTSWCVSRATARGGKPERGRPARPPDASRLAGCRRRRRQQEGGRGLP